MADDCSIIELTHWLQTPPGRYLAAWEQARMDAVVADLFGFHALQLGLPALDTLRSNRMPHRWLAELPIWPVQAASDEVPSTVPRWQSGWSPEAHFCCEPEALPFEDRSLDLVTMPHTLELATDPHRSLAEVARVLRPEGRVVISGFNPVSLWGLRQRAGHVRQSFGGRSGRLFLPAQGEFIGYWRLRDWLRLLGLEMEIGQLGCYRPPLASPAWLDRFAWTERVGERWWPVLGAVYCLVAVKRVRGMRLIGLARQKARGARTAAQPVVSRHTPLEPCSA